MRSPQIAKNPLNFRGSGGFREKWAISVTFLDISTKSPRSPGGFGGSSFSPPNPQYPWNPQNPRATNDKESYTVFPPYLSYRPKLILSSLSFYPPYLSYLPKLRSEAYDRSITVNFQRESATGCATVFATYQDWTTDIVPYHSLYDQNWGHPDAYTVHFV